MDRLKVLILVALLVSCVACHQNVRKESVPAFRRATRTEFVNGAVGRGLLGGVEGGFASFSPDSHSVFPREAGVEVERKLSSTYPAPGNPLSKSASRGIASLPTSYAGGPGPLERPITVAGFVDFKPVGKNANRRDFLNR